MDPTRALVWYRRSRYAYILIGIAGWSAVLAVNPTILSDMSESWNPNEDIIKKKAGQVIKIYDGDKIRTVSRADYLLQLEKERRQTQEKFII